jgi:hypothetical protein
VLGVICGRHFFQKKMDSKYKQDKVVFTVSKKTIKKAWYLVMTGSHVDGIFFGTEEQVKAQLKQALSVRTQLYEILETPAMDVKKAYIAITEKEIVVSFFSHVAHDWMLYQEIPVGVLLPHSQPGICYSSCKSYFFQWR